MICNIECLGAGNKWYTLLSQSDLEYTRYCLKIIKRTSEYKNEGLRIFYRDINSPDKYLYEY